MSRQHGSLGRLAPHPVETHPRVTLEDHLDLTALPNLSGVTVDYASNVPSWPMYMNDQIGDCTFAAAGHMIQAWTAYASSEVTVANSDILHGYEVVGGYVPGNPSTDNGCVMQDVCHYWATNGIAGHKISAYAQVRDCKNPWMLKQVLDLFGTVYLGINCPQSALDQFNVNEIWSYVPGSLIAGGHAIPLQRMVPVGSEHGIMDIVTWGSLHPMTIKFAEQYIEEAWVIITPDWIEANGDAPNGLNLASLQADFAQLT